jgi:hypothetical protein
MFSFALFASIDLFLQLVWTIVRKLCNDVCNFEREKTMLAIQVLQGFDIILQIYFSNLNCLGCLSFL